MSNLRAIEAVTQTWIKDIESTIIKTLETDSSRLENLRSIVSKYPIIEVRLSEKSSTNIQLYCIVCSCKGLMKKPKKFVEISLSGMEYNFRTLKNINNDKTSSKASTYD